jgi:ABC-type bacteriocin/lantibiotic exporter with double-glycine peptidase domain
VPLPAIAHWGADHFVVVERIDQRRVAVIDPASGRRKMSASEFSRGFSGVLLAFAPAASFTTRCAPPRRSRWQLLRPYVAAEPRLLGEVVVASLLLQGVALVAPLLAKVVVDRVTGSQPAGGLHSIGIALLALVAATVALNAARSVTVLHVQARADATLTVGFLRRLMSLPYAFFERRGTGDLGNRLASSAVIRESLTRQCLATVLDGAMAVGLLTVVFVLDAPTGGVVLLVAAVDIVIGLVLGRRARELAAAEVAAEADSQRYLLETLTGVQSLKAAGAEMRAVEHWRHLFERRQHAGLRRGRVAAAIDVAGATAQAVVPAVLLWTGGVRVLAGTMTLGTMVAVNAMAFAALVPLISVVSGLQRLQFVGSLVDRLADVFDAEPERRDGRRLTSFAGRIDLTDVSFRYAAHAPLALDRCSLSIDAGATVAIVGRSGSGKSTLAGLLVLLHEPTEGTIRFDGVAAGELEPRALRRRFGVVLQDPSLFSGSIRDNIALHDPDMALDDVVHAARLAAIHDDIVGLPMGYATVLSDGGGGLSGGQRQRLALARALAARPAVLVLDEATSQLDVLTESAVDRALRTVGCTRVIIAHRLSTVRCADEIVVLDHGRIVERGSHDDLLHRGGHFADLVAEQLTADAVSAFIAPSSEL